jgi:magnesium chelatase family protein
VTCRLAPRCEESYKARISGPLWDRIDIQIAVAPVKATDLALPPSKETSACVAERVRAARSIQSRRFSVIGNDEFTTNARCPAALLEEFCPLNRDGLRLLEQAAEANGLSARGYHRTLRLARTISDLDGSPDIHVLHIAEALSLRGEGSRAQRGA